MTDITNLSLSNEKAGKESICSFSEIVEMLENIERYYKEQYNFTDVVDYYGETHRKSLVAQSVEPLADLSMSGNGFPKYPF